MPPLRHAPAPQRAGGAWSGMGGLSARGDGGPPTSGRSAGGHSGGGVDTRASSPAALDMGLPSLPVQPMGADSLAMDSARSERPASHDHPFGGGGLHFAPASTHAAPPSPSASVGTDGPATDSSRNHAGTGGVGAGFQPAGSQWGGGEENGYGYAGDDSAFNIPTVHTADLSGDGTGVEGAGEYAHSGAPTGSTEDSVYAVGDGLQAGALTTDAGQSAEAAAAGAEYAWDTPYESNGQWLVMSSAHGVWITYQDWAAYHNAAAAAGAAGGAEGGEVEGVRQGSNGTAGDPTNYAHYSSDGVAAGEA